MAISQTSKTTFLRQIVADIEAEKIGIPIFQRSYVWTEDKVIDLFDSINKGYPIGAIVLWGKDGKPMKRREFLSDAILEEKANVYYVLDGRQRLTTFFGCISKNPHKLDIFKLAYNIKEDAFEYTVKSEYPVRNSDFLIQISDIFDTFTLIGILQDLSVKYQGSEKNLNVFLNNAKRLNSKLQEYQIVQIMLDYCDLDEANIVFSRINSKGTKIKKAEMLQAVNYQDGLQLLADEIQQIQESLVIYNFDRLSQDDILNCFFKFVNKDFYSMTFKDMESLDLISHLEDVKDTVIRTAEFLYKDCGVVDIKLLPYSRQFILLTFFFKEHRYPDAYDRRELRKWFYYTTYNTLFQNSSLANIRRIAKRFDAFVNMDKSTPIEYNRIIFSPEYNFRLSLQSARSKYLILAMLNRYKKLSDPWNNITFEGLVKFGGANSENYFAITSPKDKEFLTNIFTSTDSSFGFSSKRLQKFGLSKDMLYNFSIDKEAYRKERWSVFYEIEKELWDDIKY